jgi:general secretion pathway protein K
MDRAAMTGARAPALRRTQRGLALIIAMLVAALAAAITVSLGAAQTQWTAQVANRRDKVQAQSIALAGIQWTRQVLDADGRATTIDHPGEPWALPLPPTPVENGSVEGRIVDAQSFLNANNLRGGAHATFERRRFERLFETQRLPSELLGVLVDQATPPLRMQELATARAMTPAALAVLMRYVTALPEDTPLNVNTASSEALAASIANVDAGAMTQLIASRAGRPFTSLADFRQRLPAGASIGDEAMYTVKSRYFLVSVRARQGDTIAQAHALVDRGGRASSRVVWQTVE